MKTLEYYFSNRALLKSLSLKRSLLAKKRHDKMFHAGIFDTQVSDTGKKHLLEEIFPPRNIWIRISRDERKGKTALDINAIQLERTVLRITNKFKNTPKENWEIKLYEVLEDIKKRVLEGIYMVPIPRILHQFKKKEDGISIFRPIAEYSYIDRIIISQCNKYLTQCFDPLFEDCSYAFRASNTRKSYTHHQAVRDIIEFKRSMEFESLWVSECDIKKFYDCVNHDVLKSVLKKKIRECQKIGIEINETAISILCSYLDSYTFNRYVRTINLGKKAEFGWVKKSELEVTGSDPVVDNLGIPQGGAFSCLMANLLMDEVDKEVLKHQDGSLFYARFCDDMVLIHPEKEICEAALSSYTNGLKSNKLIHHRFESVLEYGQEFWSSKSKAPYKWESIKDKSSIPWLSFVGYQIRHDLTVRVRRSSLQKEVEKQVKELGQIIKSLKSHEKIKISKKAVKFRVGQRLLSMSIGRHSIFKKERFGQMCWTAGFKILKEEDYIKFQSKYLDRKRGSQLARLSTHLKKIDQSKFSSKTPVALKKEPKYYGAPFSYHYQFLKPKK
ncbi:MAG: reverse transcriptase domain-containing protein [Cyclobacteriaceae bacterium]